MIFLFEAQPARIDWLTIGLSVISSIGTAVLAAIITIQLKSVDFRFDYKKYILEKRKHAYEKSNIIFETLSYNYHFKIGPLAGQACHLIFYDPKHATREGVNLNDFQNNIIDIGGNRMWYSQQFFALIIQLNAVLIDIQTKFLTEMTFDERLQIACSYHETIQGLRSQLMKQYMKDITTLHDVKSFIKKFN